MQRQGRQIRLVACVDDLPSARVFVSSWGNWSPAALGPGLWRGSAQIVRQSHETCRRQPSMGVLMDRVQGRKIVRHEEPRDAIADYTVRCIKQFLQRILSLRCIPLHQGRLTHNQRLFLVADVRWLRFGDRGTTHSVSVRYSHLLTSRQLRRQIACTSPRRVVSSGMKRDGRSFDQRTLEAIRLRAVERVRNGEHPATVTPLTGSIE